MPDNWQEILRRAKEKLVDALANAIVGRDLLDQMKEAVDQACRHYEREHGYPPDDEHLDMIIRRVREEFLT